MSAIQLLEKIGANAELRYSQNDELTNEQIKNLIDICPDVVCILVVPAEDDDTDEESDDESKENESENSIKKAS